MKAYQELIKVFFSLRVAMSSTTKTRTKKLSCNGYYSMIPPKSQVSMLIVVFLDKGIRVPIKDLHV